MKFFCDNCQAQYMISDEKVGPAGVRVRCKKCSHVIYVKRLDEASDAPEDATVVMTAEKMAALSASINAGRDVALQPAPDVAAEEAPPASDPGAEAPGRPVADHPMGSSRSFGLEEEIGNALDSMFSDGETSPSEPVAPSPGSRAAIVIGSPRTQAPIVPSSSSPVAASVAAVAPQGFAPSPAGGVADDRAETRIFTSSDMEKIASDTGASESEAAPPSGAGATATGTEWFIAVRDEQVGPLNVDQIKDRFEAGEVAGDTLVWSTGLTDWRPLSSVEELAEQILPKREVVRASKPAAPQSQASKDSPRKEAVTFKPAAASALASLASMAREEMAASAKPATSSAAPSASADLGAEFAAPKLAPAPEPRSTDMLIGLPSPSPDIPMGTQPMAPLPSYSNGQAVQQRSNPADFRESPLARSRPRSSDGVNVKLIAGIGAGVLVLIAGSALGIYFGVVKPNQEAAAKQELALKAAQEAAAKALEAAAKANQPPAPVAAVAPTPAPAPPAQTPAPAAKTVEHEREHHGSGGGGHHHEKEASAGAAAPAPTSAPAAEKPAAKSGDGFLDGTDVDKEFANELDGKPAGEGKPQKHGPYIPPPPGQADLPSTLSQSDIVSAITQHRDAFAKCVNDQKRRDPSSSGTVVVHWRIRPDGRPTDVVVKGEDSESPLATCFKTQVKGVHFGQYHGPQMAPIDFPFSY